MRSIFFLVLFLFSFNSEARRKNEDNLTLKEAQSRKAQIKSVEYFLDFSFWKGKETFEGTTRIEVELKDTKSPLSIDLLAKEIREVKVNGVVLKKFPKRTGSFDIPVASLSPKMSITVAYTGEFSRAASGPKRSVDPEDGAEYIFTDFEPYYAHWLFPCFDQPDLKAIYHVTVTAPSEWKVIHNELPEKTHLEEEQTVTIFKPTKPLSTYLFFVGAGPFVEWTDSYGDLPISLYARKSLAKYVDSDKIMETTKKGLKFFNDYFGYPYPFSKYAHVYIPEFAWGGMENPGAVTLNERMIFRGPVPKSKMEKRDSLILHEMAHMWFGDLVTMEWWNDLWLNESFASYLASVAMDRALKSEATWLEFFAMKTWGYWQDQLVTTHPIETDVPDVRTAKGNFDGITYAKGAASLKQLHFFVGEEGFRNGLRDYFNKYAFSNTRRQDFIGSIAMASQTDLTEWTTKWLQTAGPQRVVAEPQCEGKKLTKLLLHQKPSVSGTLSPHRTRLGFFEADDDELELDRKLDLIYIGEKLEITDVKGKDCPDFIFPNLDDLDYALFSLDQRSLGKVKLALTGIPEPLTRLMIWNILYQMVRDGELGAQMYMSVALETLKTEKDDFLLGSLLGRRSQLKTLYAWYLDKEERSKLAPELEALLWKRVGEEKAGSSLQMNFFDFLVSIAQTPDSLQKLHEALVKNKPPKGITLDQDRRWAILLTLSAQGKPEAMKLVEAELKRDPSTNGKRLALSARVAYPELSQKKSMWKELMTNKEFTHSDLEEAGMHLHHPNYPELSKPFLEEYMKKLTTLDWKAHDDKVDVYFESLYPHALCTTEFQKLSAKKLAAARNLTVLAKRSWTEQQDELDRCVKVRGFSPEVPARQ